MAAEKFPNESFESSLNTAYHHCHRKLQSAQRKVFLCIGALADIPAIWPTRFTANEGQQSETKKFNQFNGFHGGFQCRAGSQICLQ